MEKENLDFSKIEELFKFYYKTLCNIAYRIVGDRDAAEDVVQEVFIKLWERKEEITIDSSIKGYLFKSVSNAAINYLQKNRALKYKEEISENTHAAYLVDGGNKMDEKELEARIEKAIEKLPPKCKAIFVLSRFEEMKYQEIAQHLNISIKTVESQMGIALEKLRHALTPYMNKEFLFMPILMVLSGLMS